MESDLALSGDVRPATRLRRPARPTGGPCDTSPSGREWGWVCTQLEIGIASQRVYARLVDRLDFAAEPTPSDTPDEPSTRHSLTSVASNA